MKCLSSVLFTLFLNGKGHVHFSLVCWKRSKGDEVLVFVVATQLISQYPKSHSEFPNLRVTMFAARRIRADMVGVITEMALF